jgi:alanine racemase
MPNRPCWVEIRTQALEENYRLLASTAPGQLLAVVKSEAYGHGLALCAPAAVRAGARWLGVTTVEEAIAARALCPQAEILVISGPFPLQGPAVIAHRLTAVLWEPWQLAELEQAARAANCPPNSVPVHLEIDTGMSRQGIAPEAIPAFLAHFSADRPLRLGGIMTHLYAAEESNHLITNQQLASLAPVLDHLHAAGLHTTWLNVGNSAAVLDPAISHSLATLAAAHGMRLMLRPGLALYGLAPAFTPTEPAVVTALRTQLQPVLTWKTRIVGIRTLLPGQLVGYNGTFVATEPMRIALLAVGYADGLRRSLSNCGHVLVAGQRAPIVGRISMDQATIDVTEIPNLAPGDEVVLLGSQGSESIPAEEHAALEDTIVWEVFTSIGSRVQRRPV